MDDTIQQVITIFTALILFFAGYALIPFAFRFTGGMVATLGGFGQKMRGFDPAKKFRANKVGQNVGALKSGERFQGTRFIPGSSRAASALNNASVRAGTKRFGLGAQGQRALTEKRSLLAAQHAKSDAGQAGQFNDDMLRAQTYTSEAEARQRMAQDWDWYKKKKNEQTGKMEYVRDDNGNLVQDTSKINNAITAAKANGGFGQARQIAATKQLAATGTGYDDVGQMAQTIARVSKGRNDAVHDMVGAMRGVAKQSGRVDLGGAGHSTIANLAQEYADGGITAKNERDKLDEVLVEAARSTDNATLVRGKPTSTSQVSAAIGRQLNTAVKQGNSTYAAELTAKVQNMQGATMYGHELGTSAMNQGKSGDGTEGRGFENTEVATNVVNIQTAAQKTLREMGPDGSVTIRPNNNHDPVVAARFRQQAQRPHSPDDPNIPHAA